MVYICLQPGTRNRGERPVAVVWSLRCRAVGEGDPGSADEQVQGIRIRDHDQLR